MPNPTIRISLPGYDCLTDTNLDHYALYADQDNILIKEFTRGTASIAGNGATKTIVHNFGYIPFFLVYVNFAFNQPNGWALIPAYQNDGFQPASYIATSDTGTITITNNAGTSYLFNWYVFYDNFTQTAGSFTPSNQAARVSIQGKDAGTSRNPNDYIFHSDLNTFKIIREGTTSINYTSGTAGGTYSFFHNANLGTPSSYAVFMKFPDGYTTFLPGGGAVYSYNSNWNVFNTSIDATQIAMNINGTGNALLPVKYYVFETPLGTL